jgi:hypothetical protein
MEGRADPDSRRSFPTDHSGWNPELQAWVRDAIALRRSSSAFRAPEVPILAAEGMAMAYLRRSDEAAFVVAVNAGEAAVEMALELPFAPSAAGVVLGAADDPPSVSGPRLTMRSPARRGVVIRLEG